MSSSMRLQQEKLEEFGKVCAKRPIDLSEVAKCRKIIEELGGEGLVVEACAIVATYVAATKMVDCTGVKFPPKAKTYILPIVNFFIRVRLFFKRL